LNKIYFLCKYIIKKTQKMLSILIPTYNYYTIDLVKELSKQANLENIDFEIIVGDDCSSNLEIVNQNQAINLIKNCSYSVNSKNLGRGGNRNLLVKKARYSWVLFLDCDVFPKDSNFIKNYIDCVKFNDFKIHFGGLIYDSKRPKKEEMLRWIYGNKRESITLEDRKLKPYESTLTSNILIKKELLERFPFHSEIKNYGYEDLVFVLELKKKKLIINHLENPVFHLNLEESMVFLTKFESSLTNLKYLIDHKIINNEDSKFSNLHTKLEKMKLTSVVAFSYRILKLSLLKNLTSNNPLLFVFDFYRIGFYCNLFKKKI
jgi:glycosyltransferase involved in cell wall biosynthesis